MKKYLVDPQLVLDILENHPVWAERATALFASLRDDELVLAPTSYLALGPAFMGIRSMQDRFLDNFGIKVSKNAPARVLDAAYAAWNRYQQEHTHETGGMRVFDSLYIGAFALVFDGIVTRQGDLYRRYFDTLEVVEP